MYISTILAPMFIGYTEIILLVVLALVFFGGKKIPELMRGMGRGIKEFKDAVNKDYSDDPDAAGSKDAKTAAPAPKAATATPTTPTTPTTPEVTESVAAAQSVENLPLAEPVKAPAKRRGRPKKSTAAVAGEAPAAQPKRRGRPKKSVAEPAPEQPKRRPGRPKKINN